MKQVERQRIHVYPADRQGRSAHVTTRSGDCWCEPMPRQVCPVAVYRDGEWRCELACWRCGGSAWVMPYDETLPLVLLHSAVRRRPRG